MHCIQEKDTLNDYSMDKDPLDTSDLQNDPDSEPESKRPKLNLDVFNIPLNIPKSLSIFPTSSSTLPNFVNNPLNLANPLALNTNGSNTILNPVKRFSMPSKLTITPSKPLMPQRNFEISGNVVRYKKNGEVAKKRGPPKGYKRKPKSDLNLSLPLPIPASISCALTQAQNALLTSLLANSANLVPTPTKQPKVEAKTVIPPLPARITVVPNYPKPIVPKGTELVELDLDPADWFPDEPYKMVFSKKKNPKWKEFPYRCEHCFKGYRVLSTLLSHTSTRHGSVPSCMAVPCPCCPHVSLRRKHHKKHLESHEGRKRRIFCLYCLPVVDPNEPHVKESVKYPWTECPQYWYASEESLRLHKKRKHPYSALYNYNWFGSWGPSS